LAEQSEGNAVSKGASCTACQRDPGDRRRTLRPSTRALRLAALVEERGSGRTGHRSTTC